MSTWKPFSPSQRNYKGPPLFIKSDVVDTSYQIIVTDLTHTWQEKLVWSAIVGRSIAEDTVIDLREKDQANVFREHLRGALEGSGTVARELVAGDDSTLTLRITKEMPGDLRDFVWNAHITLQPPERLSTELFLPALRIVAETHEEVSILKEKLREKDYCIRKLMERIKASGISLETVFPSAVPPAKNKRPLQSERPFLDKVPGLAEFDDWKFTKSRRIRQRSIVKSQVTVKLPEGGLSCPPSAAWKSPGRWWRNLAAWAAQPPPTAVVLDSQPKSASLPSRNSHDFEVITWDSREPASGAQPARDTQGNLTTTSESMVDGDQAPLCVQEGDSISPPRSSLARREAPRASPAPRASEAPQASGPPQAGGSAEDDTMADADMSPDVEVAEARMSRQFDDDDDATTEGSIDGRGEIPQEQPAQRAAESAQATPSKRIGTIGGKKQPAATEPPSTSAQGARQAPNGDASPSKAPAPPAQKRIGRIGGSRAPQAPSPMNDAEAAQPTGASNAGQDHQLSEDPADRNRAEMKRALEEKRKAPAKKKRKF